MFSFTLNGRVSSGLLILIFWFFSHFLSNTSGLRRRSVIDVKRPDLPLNVEWPALLDIDVRLVLVVNNAGVGATERTFVVGWLLSKFVVSVVSPWLLFEDEDSFKSESIFAEFNWRSNRSLASLIVLCRPVWSSWENRMRKKDEKKAFEDQYQNWWYPVLD